MFNFVKRFVEGKGHFVFLSSIVEKIVLFILNLILIYSLTKEVFGSLTYAQTIISIIVPFAGLGLNHSLLYFGSNVDTNQKKKELYNYTLRKGTLNTLPIVLILIITSYFITYNLPSSFFLLIGLSLSLFTKFFYQTTLSYIRIIGKNKIYSKINISYSVLLLILTVLLLTIVGVWGYVISVFAVGIIASTYVRRKFEFKNAYKPKNRKAYAKYGFYAGVGSIASQLTLLTDNLMIANLIKDEISLAEYRVGSLFVLQSLFIPVVIFISDFVSLSVKSRQKEFLIKYIKEYWKLISLILLVLSIPFFFIPEFTISIFFGDKYSYASQILRVLFIGLIGAYLLRIPFGNILAAMGKSNLNAVNSAIMFVLNIAFNIFLISKYGIIGAAYSTTMMFWGSGLLSLLFFVYVISGKIPNRLNEL